jgi:hypothetical protein
MNGSVEKNFYEIINLEAAFEFLHCTLNSSTGALKLQGVSQRF